MTCEQKIIIAGPCSAESEIQTWIAATMVTTAISAVLGKNKVRVAIRSPLTKEPTFPSTWIGPGEEGFRWLVDACKESDAIPATEITSVQEAIVVLRLCNELQVNKLFIWFGSRFFKGQEIKKAIHLLMNGVTDLQVGLKNPPNANTRDWEGRIAWALAGGIAPSNLWLIGRGHDPQGLDNPLELRNLPNDEETMSLGKKHGLKIISDPSHKGGTSEKVLTVLQETPNDQFDGWMLETCPTRTKTDDKQRLDTENFIQAVQVISNFIQP